MRTGPAWHRTAVLVTVSALAAGAALVTSVTVAQPSGAAAAAPTITAPVVTYNHSCTRTAKTQGAMNQCAAKEVRELQHQLKAALAKQKKGGSSSFVRHVQAAQNSFVAYEKAECTAVAAPNVGGSIYPLVFGSCEVRLTVQRIQEVREDLSGFLGG
jgi:uncharacterized protein YecT (DUF1311 family)